jgi:hypothetical protein
MNSARNTVACTNRDIRSRRLLALSLPLLLLP